MAGSRSNVETRSIGHRHIGLLVYFRLDNVTNEPNTLKQSNQFNEFNESNQLNRPSHALNDHNELNQSKQFNKSNKSNQSSPYWPILAIPFLLRRVMALSITIGWA